MDFAHRFDLSRRRAGCMIVHQCGAGSNFEEESGILPCPSFAGGRASTQGWTNTLARNSAGILTPK